VRWDPAHHRRPVSARATDRIYDIIVWGATGYMGRLVAEYLARCGPADLRWALGGRDLRKLEAVRRELASLHPKVAELPLEVGDSQDADALDRLAAKTAVVCTTVGPYSKYGEPLVAACVRQGTDYCDLCGEVDAIRRIVDQRHEPARERGCRIVTSCGFDSIPSDIGTLMMQMAMRERHGVPAQEVKLAVVALRGGFSGGTVASIVHLTESMKRAPSLRELVADPYALDPKGSPRGSDRPDAMGVRFDPDFGWTGPFVMAGINTRIVRRSHALLGHPDGADFRYQEFMGFRRGPVAFTKAAMLSLGVIGFLAGLSMRPTRAVLTRFVLPAPGEGPTPAQREAGFFEMRLVARGQLEGRTVAVWGRIAGDRDPGYADTARMLGESALCLARDPLTSPGGVLTPRVAMGKRLLERLRAAGSVYAVDED